MKKHLAILVASLFLVLPVKLIGQSDAGIVQQYKYREAVVDAMVAEESEICSTLVSIRPENAYLSWSNGYVLMLTWTNNFSSCSAGDTVIITWGDTWATAVPELKDWYRKHPADTTDRILRTKQLLGLPPSCSKTSFIELWVKPSDLFRPAYDSAIDKKYSGIQFPANATQDYIDWFDNNIITSYYPPRSTVTLPWTRLGYTYDWGSSGNKVGLSEFIIKKNARVIIKTKSRSEDYLSAITK